MGDKILFQLEIFRHDRFLLPSTGVIPHDQMLRSTELYGIRVAPDVRRAVRDRSDSTNAIGITGT